MIELRLREYKGLFSVVKKAEEKGSKICKSIDLDSFLKSDYDEALSHVENIKKANPQQLIDLPDLTPNNEQNLINLRDWCTDSRVLKSDQTELPDDLVSCQEVALAMHKRSDSVARSLKKDGFYVIKLGGKCYCRLKHAMVRWPERKNRLKKLSNKDAD